mmetsp:Transcript_35570/g.42837  ORF Transcript_35570/g.42837 Transcript_35570/m.42837 type:complete len:214 (+) Transcript_35570:124-765(+)|eukprot:CAMPEP_0197844218 /NCGR_PEP_ID=MMETSP1438-20131217/1207_1 /TAXON_ID=1461541 /ORGANISM="Pterosperma sp., Strain CCMP1384" /LENGTH=213 /DNA_ID=CAMNT_0043454887 /DNA_START=82 /DNA_END=723 /DNA_ORIENTATION=-
MGVGADFEVKQLLYYANICDYFRLLFLWIGLQEGQNFIFWYVVSYGLDAIDGELARRFNQCSRLGYYLDMIIDRISSCLALHLASKVVADFPAPYNMFHVGFVLCILLVELLSHGLVVYMSEVKGVHQKAMGHQYTVVRMYLDSKPMLLAACAGYEGLCLSLIGYAQNGAGYWYWTGLACLPLFIFRALANLTRLRACFELDMTKQEQQNKKR